MGCGSSTQESHITAPPVSTTDQHNVHRNGASAHDSPSNVEHLLKEQDEEAFVDRGEPTMASPPVSMQTEVPLISDSKLEVFEEDESSGAEDIRALLQNVTIAILQKLVTVLEYESLAFAELAKKRNVQDYFELMKPKVYRNLFEELLIVPPDDSLAEPSPRVSRTYTRPQNDADTRRVAFAKFLERCKLARYKHQYTKQHVLARYKAAAKIVSDDLRQSYNASDISALKIELDLFSLLLLFVDVDKPDLLFDNVTKVMQDADDF